jgi:TonB-dependent Receptor Plug Domain
VTLLRGRLAAALLLVVLSAFAAATPTAAQIPDAVADSIRADSIRTDSLRRAEKAEYDERFLAQRRKGDSRLPAHPRLGDDGPMADGLRMVFSRDSVVWMQAQTLGDVLAQVPGTYLWRGGWLGAAELANYRARGAASVEYFLDGVPYQPLGPDSTTVDPASMGLSLLDRIEVERWPGQLRVLLFTRRHERLATHSLIGLARGSNSLTRLQVELDARGRKGIIFGLGADYFNSGVTPGQPGDFFRNTPLWLQFGWTPSARRGVVLQLVRSTPRRLSATSIGDTLAPDALDGKRADWLLRGYLRKQDDGMGVGVDVLAGLSTWDGNQVSQSAGRLGGSASWRAPTASASITALYQTLWTPLDLRARAGWTPTRAFALNGEGVFQLHDGGRSAQWLGAGASMALLRYVRLQGSVRAGRMVALPAVETDEPQTVLDAEGTVGWESRILGAHVGLAQTAGFRVPAFGTFSPIVSSIEDAPATTWLTARGRFVPLNWLAVDGWYETPIGDAPQGLPVDHLMGTASIRSKFLRAFKSSAFDLKASVSFERWGVGVLGSDGTGTVVNQVAQNYLRYRIQFAIESFTAFFEQANTLGQVTGYVPGLPIPQGSQIFGVRWGFTN